MKPVKGHTSGIEDRRAQREKLGPPAPRKKENPIETGVRNLGSWASLLTPKKSVPKGRVGSPIRTLKPLKKKPVHMDRGRGR